jgi:tetratricopeptide (TPR) repeat protein
MEFPSNDIRELQDRASAAFEAGQLREAAALYQQLLELRPDGDAFHFRLGLVHKYLREWPQSLRHNLRSLALSGEHDEAASWNAGIAATALGDWPEARRQWLACGIDIEPGEGPIEENFGPIGLRLNPWSGQETVFAHRIDPARARIANVPLPDSGHRYRDLVLHDGAQTGERRYFSHVVPVFNELQRLEPSEFVTFTVFVGAGSDDDIEALQRTPMAGIGLAEDWTGTVKNSCLRCSYGVPHKHHRHEAGNPTEWNPDRTLGVAAQTESAVRSLLEAWVAQEPRLRRLDAIECREQAAAEPALGLLWWRGPKPR